MAGCKKCNKPVGCGCNLNKEGLCASCAEAKRKEAEAAAKAAAEQKK